MEKDNSNKNHLSGDLSPLDYLGNLHAGFTSLKSVLETAVPEVLSVTDGEYYQWGPMTLIFVARTGWPT
jgi:hypothetical protein